jgi:hypothetical protein
VSDQLILTGKRTLVPDDYTEFNYYVNNTQPAVSCLVNNGSTRTSIQRSKTAFINPVVLDHKGNYTMLDANFEGICNATDSPAGNAVLKAVLWTSRSTAY